MIIRFSAYKLAGKLTLYADSTQCFNIMHHRSGDWIRDNDRHLLPSAQPIECAVRRNQPCLTGKVRGVYIIMQCHWHVQSSTHRPLTVIITVRRFVIAAEMTNSLNDGFVLFAAVSNCSVCQQSNYCINTTIMPGLYLCRCQSGYTINPKDSYSCIGISLHAIPGLLRRLK